MGLLVPADLSTENGGGRLISRLDQSRCPHPLSSRGRRVHPGASGIAFKCLRAQFAPTNSNLAIWPGAEPLRAPSYMPMYVPHTFWPTLAPVGCVARFPVSGELTARSYHIISFHLIPMKQLASPTPVMLWCSLKCAVHQPVNRPASTAMVQCWPGRRHLLASAICWPPRSSSPRKTLRKFVYTAVIYFRKVAARRHGITHGARFRRSLHALNLEI